MHSREASHEETKSEIAWWDIKHWIGVSMFLAAASVLVFPTGAAGGLILLTCSILYLVCHSRQAEPVLIARHELWFLGSMVFYPLAVMFSLLSAETMEWRYFDNPSRFLLALPLYWAIRKSKTVPDALVMGSIVGAAGAGILAVYQWTALGYERPYGLTNAIPFSQVTLILVCTALTPIVLPRVWTWARVAGVGLGIIAVFLAKTRGVWIAIPIMIWLMVEWFPGYALRHRRLAAVAIVMAVMGLLLVAPAAQVRIADAFDGILYLFDNSTESATATPSIGCRAELWRSGWTLFSEHPWSGVGAGRYGLETVRLLDDGHVSNAACRAANIWPPKSAHNDWVQLGAEMGIPGILTYLLPLTIIYAIGRYCCRQHAHTLGVSLKIYAAVQGIFSLTQTQFSHNISTTFFAFMATSLVALAFNELECKRDARLQDPRLPSWRRRSRVDTES